MYTGLAISHDSTLLVSLSSDKTVKVFDVHTYDMMAMLRLSFVPGCAEWIYKASEPPSHVLFTALDCSVSMVTFVLSCY